MFHFGRTDRFKSLNKRNPKFETPGVFCSNASFADTLRDGRANTHVRLIVTVFDSV